MEGGGRPSDHGGEGPGPAVPEELRTLAEDLDATLDDPQREATGAVASGEWNETVFF